MQFIKNNVVTYCIGQAASMGAFLLLPEPKRKRFALPNSRILIHQPSMGRIERTGYGHRHSRAERFSHSRNHQTNLIAKHTGQPLDRIERDVERDFIMNSQQAKEYGIVDENHRPARAVNFPTGVSGITPLTPPTTPTPLKREQ